MKVLILLIAIFVVVTFSQTPKQKPLKTVIWEFLDDNMPKEWRSNWRDINAEYEKFDWDNSKSSAKSK